MEDTIKFENITFKYKERKILKMVSGTIRKNRLTAIMGPSGSGKTTLLKIFSGRMNEKYKGAIYYNNEIMSNSNLKDLSVLVHQNDLLNPFLTVEETIKFSADLRSKGKDVVDKEMKKLGLYDIKESLIGNSFKGISGGERKRVSIAKELVGNPNILFLDEPTSGLDCMRALKLIEYLESMKNHKTIVATIHQPSSEIFFKFDDLLLIKDGKIIYNGEIGNIMLYFSNLGYNFPQYSNPADYILTHILPQIDHNSIGISYEFFKLIPNKEIKSYNQINLFHQIKILLNREMKINKRNKMKAVASFFQTFIFIWILGTIFYDIPSKNYIFHIKNVSGFFYFLSLQRLLVPSSNVVNNLYINLDLCKREIESRYYTPDSLFFSRIIFDILYNIIHPIILVTSTYYLVLYPLYSYKQFFILLFCILFINIIGISFGLLFSSISPSFKISRIISSSLFMILNLISGINVDTYSLIYPIRMLQYISPMRYSYNILIKNHFKYKKTGIVNMDLLIEWPININTSFLILFLIMCFNVFIAKLFFRRKFIDYI
ncbi:ABC transporter G family member 21 [Astathelohania contejeani]|uniref:ABC transporter G family member 21 n=1 Tax=Astathelohania contejeani TaxID=164912 RepID=A0ABQ7I0R2_9MICR|nr:ABC transporter G family member 21 [Thelohania contejeani]